MYMNSEFTPKYDREKSSPYDRIDEENKQSFLLKEGWVIQPRQSFHSVGASRDKEGGTRVYLAGNMSPLNNYGPSELSTEEKIGDAQHNLHRFLERNNVHADKVRMLRPERDYSTPLTMVNIDTEPLAPDDTGILRSDLAGDMMVTFNKELSLAARPADCPLLFMTAETPQGEVTILLHLAWQGVTHDYIDQAKVYMEELGVDFDSLRIYQTPGGQAKSFTFNGFTKYNPHEEFPGYESMFTNLETTINEDGEAAHSFGIELAAEVRTRVLDSWGVDSYQIFTDTTDTTSPEAGYSSHSRSFKGYDGVGGENSRDLFMMKRA